MRFAYQDLTAGVQTDLSTLKKVKDAIPDTVVVSNTGVRIENAQEQLSIADGAIVGTALKKDGIFENHVDESPCSGIHGQDQIHSQET